MEALLNRKRDIENRLEKDEARIKQLSETLDRSAKLTNEMVGILDSFQGRLLKLDKTILPVYQKTKQLTLLQENVDHTLTALERVIGFHHIADEVEPKLNEGPTGNIDGYLKLLEKLRVAVDFFKHNNPTSMELSHVNTSFDRGIELLEKEFRDLLRRHSLQVQFSDLEKVIKQDEDKHTEPKPTIQHLPDNVVKDLNTIAKYVINVGEKSDISSEYAQIRSNNALGRTLRLYMEVGVAKKQSFPTFLQKPSPVKKQVTKRKEAMPARSKIVQGKLSTTSLLAGEKTVGSDEQLEGCSVLVRSTVVLLRLLQTEWELMEHVIPTKHHVYVFGILVNDPIKYFMHRGDVVLQNAQRQLLRHEYITIVPLLRIIKQIQRLIPDYGQLLSPLSSDIYCKFPNLVGSFEKLALKGMEEYIVYIRGDSEKYSNLPKDGTVHELTSNTMWFFEQMLEFADSAGRLHMSQERYNVHEDDEGRRKAVGSYIVRVLDALTLNLENKSRTYESTVLAAVFLMNNYYFIQQTYERNTLMLELVQLALTDIADNYKTLINNQLRAYQRGFTKLVQHLGHENITSQLSKQQRQRLKDKFKGFNTDFEELFRVQQQYSIPNPELRRKLRNENITFIGGLYTDFYQNYATTDFTKNKEKYVKFTPEEVEAKLDKFFDQGAS